MNVVLRSLLSASRAASTLHADHAFTHLFGCNGEFGPRSRRYDVYDCSFVVSFFLPIYLRASEYSCPRSVEVGVRQSVRSPARPQRKPLEVGLVAGEESAQPSSSMAGTFSVRSCQASPSGGSDPREVARFLLDRVVVWQVRHILQQ